MTTPIDVSEEAVEWLAGQCGKGPMSQRYATTLRELRRQLTAAQASQREASEMVTRYGQAILDIADGAKDEGDRAYFGSTNDLDRLRTLRDEYFEWRFLSKEELQKADAILNAQEPTNE